MAKLIGAVDGLGRPIVYVAVPGRDDSLRATVDTGFNGEVMMTAGDAAVLGVEIVEESESVELGHGHSVDVRLGRMRLEWLGRERRVIVWIGDQKSPTIGGPMLMIGTRLLKPHLLLVDFDTGVVEIETQ